MKRFVITVNGKSYDVQVDEVAADSAATNVAAPVAAAPAAAPAPTTAPTSSVPSDATKITAPMPGNVLDVKVKEGDHVEVNSLVAILEAMKMENEIFTPVAGTVVGVYVKKGDTVNSDELLISIA